jgi:esterase/lipase
LAVPTLPGHGDSLNLKGVRYHDWIEHAEHELEGLLDSCDTVYVIGFSMGGLIASYLATKYPIKKLILLSAAAYYVNPRQLAFDIREMFHDLRKGQLLTNELFSRYKRKIADTPISATWQFRKLVSNIRSMLAHVNVPTLIAQGEADGIVPPKSAQYLYDRIGSSHKKVLYFKESKHLICHSHEREDLFNEVLFFLKDEM